MSVSTDVHVNMRLSTRVVWLQRRTLLRTFDNPTLKSKIKFSLPLKFKALNLVFKPCL